MPTQQEIDSAARSHFEDLWTGRDPWETQDSEFEQGKYAHEFRLLEGRRYSRTLEIGCGAGVFTRQVATLADRVLALDIAAAAIDRARQRAGDARNIEFRVANIMDWDPRPEGPWDLIVFGDTLACGLGWLYSFVSVGHLAAVLFAASAPGGRLMLADTYGGVSGPLFRPWLVRTYHDLFIHVGYQLEKQEYFEGTKNGMDIPVLISIFQKAPESAAEREQALW